MARDADGRVLPGITSRRARRARQKADKGIGLYETRGRRSFSQRSRDLSERLRSVGQFFDGAPRLLETVATGAFVGLLVYFLRPRLYAVEYEGNNPLVYFQGKPVKEIRITYPDRNMARNAAILTALIVAPDIGGDIGSLIAPAATAGVFAAWIDKTFPGPQAGAQLFGYTLIPPYDNSEVIGANDLAFGPEGVHPGGSSGFEGTIDATLTIYTKILLRRFMRSLFVAVALFIMLRFIRNLGRQ